MLKLSLHWSTISWIHRLLRGLQLVSTVLAMTSAAACFTVTYSNGFSYRLGSHATSLTLVTSYTSALYTAWLLVCVELLALAPRPRVPMLRLLDAICALVLAVSGIVLATSDYVKHCEVYGFMVKCSAFDRSVWFTFATAALFIASIGLTFVKRTGTDSTTAEQVDLAYVIEKTPTAAVSSPGASSGDAPPTPSFKV